MNTKAILCLFVTSTLMIPCQVHAAVNCTTAGRFADSNDKSCRNYTLCVLDTSSNTYTGYNYTCPTTSVFNPDTARCTATTNYKCTN